MTLPMRASEVMLGKYLAALAFYLVALAGHPAPAHHGHRPWATPTWAPSGAATSAPPCWAALYLGVGTFTSGLMRDQISAVILGIMACFLIFIVGVPGVAATIDGWLPGFGSFLQHYLGLIGPLRHDAARRDLPGRPGLLPGPDRRLPHPQHPLAGREEVLMNSKRRNFRLTFAVAAVLLAAIAFFLISVLGNLRGARVDMTSDKLFTMSPAAAKILRACRCRCR